MFKFESSLTREIFLENLKGEDFKWMFSTQAVRDQVDKWLDFGFK